ncbi:unnamed protein product [Acanthoscelides obtectus]|uniref:Fibronectin type III domain-containing protein n=1 Tax=Acanthoscelides obtectus TaxID=200917 RepID=A0A9P0VSJ5_ACAOB|nr:unnamed protein product [Acanthoscelides obtectus]CAK1626653.1 hypothetical protein AOBTE_LOCUS4007 [Acanthoscelides obtectus]
MSFSKYNVNALTDPLSVLPSPIIRRPRQNSVFVGSPGALAALTMGAPPPRRVKSAVDIQHLLIASDRISPTGNRKDGEYQKLIQQCVKQSNSLLRNGDYGHYIIPVPISQTVGSL